MQAQLVIDRDTASRLGVAAQDIDNALYDAFGQRQVSTMYRPLNQYHVVMEVAPRVPTDHGGFAEYLPALHQRRAHTAGGIHSLHSLQHTFGGESPEPVSVGHDFI